MSYSVTLSNGKSFGSLGVSGDYFVSKEAVSAADLAEGMDRVIISGEPAEGESWPPIAAGVYTNLDVVHVFRADGESYICIREHDTSEAEALRDRADIEYLAMMTGVEL